MAALAAPMVPTMPSEAFGISGRVWLRPLSPAVAQQSPLLRRTYGSQAGRPGWWPLRDSVSSRVLLVATESPLAIKTDGWVGRYRVGDWPGEHWWSAPARTSLPSGLLIVPAALATVPVSAFFRLSAFLTHDQTDIWPKVLVLSPRLLDKLELVGMVLERRGYRGRLRVMSGFRTPAYNRGGGDVTGRASESRHMYGEAADVYVEGTTPGTMTDLTGDGRVDIEDARVVAAVAEAIEQAYPSLTGGLGLYPATTEHGPFVHIDVRGTRARW
jgi:hypothetical protein